MNILFISYAEVALCRGNIRSIAMVYALADAGHRIDLITPYADLPEHSNIRVLVHGEDRPIGRAKLRIAAMRAVQRTSYQAVHAVDEAVFFALRLSQWKNIPLIYDAVWCFNGRAGVRPSSPRHFFSKRLKRMEVRVLERAGVIFSSCGALSADLRSVDPNAQIITLESIPAQPLYVHQNTGKERPLDPAHSRVGQKVVCSALPGYSPGFRELLMAARKVIDVVPDSTFFFKGIASDKAKIMAGNLDIADQCVFLSDDPQPYLSALEMADAILMIPHAGSRYIHSEVYTLLYAAAPLVTIRDGAYDEVLTEKTSLRVLPDSESIAEGLLRVIQEPLFSLAVALEGQQLVAAHHTYSSFKHKVRMTYHQWAVKAP